MPSELTLRAHHQGGMRVLAEAGTHAVPTDYPLKPGQETAGMTSLQLLLASLATCSANGLSILLARQAGCSVSDLEVQVKAQRRDEHPTILTDIHLAFRITGTGLEEAKVARALATAETQLCPVWAMLRGTTPIHTSFSLMEPQA